MLANKAASHAQLILRGCSYHTPATSVAFSRLLQTRGNTSKCMSTLKKQRHPLLTKHDTVLHSPSLVRKPAFVERQWFATQPIISSHDDAFARDLSLEEFDNAYKFLYEQHKHPRGPWVKVLESAQSILAGKKSPRILVIGSGPGEPASTLATNFPHAEIISAHSTAKCIEWANQRFHQLALSNVTPRMVPNMQNLDVFADGSFDLVASIYGIANAPDPEAVLHEIHRVMKPGGSFLTAVWEQLPADPGSDIILRHACIGPNTWHKTEDNVDAVGSFRCPVRAKRPMSLSKPHLLESMIEKAKFSLVQVTRDEYPLKLGSSKEAAFKTLTLPIRSELQKLKDANHYHPSHAAEVFEDVLNEGFMVKQNANGEMEVPYNVYKYVVARRQFEDNDAKKEFRNANTNGSSASRKSTQIKPVDVKQDPVTFDTWVRMKSAASDKIVNAVNKQLKVYKDRDDVNILDAAPSPYGETAIAIASSNPSASIIAASRSTNVAESIREQVRNQGVGNVTVRELDPSHLSAFKDKTFDVVVCSFGLTFLNSPEAALKELRRVLKPGGSMVISVWEDLALSQLTAFIIDEMRTSSMEDFTVDAATDTLRTLQPYAKPRALEALITNNGFDVTRVDHETARILLSDSKCPEEFGVNVATLPIRPLLQELEKSGQNKTVFDNARKAFKRLLNDPSLVSHDKEGNATTTLPSRFKLVIATRPHEDSDGFLDQVKSPHRNGRKTFKFDDIPK